MKNIPKPDVSTGTSDEDLVKVKRFSDNGRASNFYVLTLLMVIEAFVDFVKRARSTFRRK